jgi:hypothetical protein
MKGFLVVISLLFLNACSSTPTTPNSINVRQMNLEQLAEFWTDLDKSDNRVKSLEEWEYALSSWVYSAVADRTYIKPERICFPLDEEWQSIEIEKDAFEVLQRNGFYAQAWHRISFLGAKELIIAYRGTDGVDDFWRGNFSFFKSPFSRSQFDSAIFFRDLVLDKVSKNSNYDFDYIVFVGHSLGGGLAQYAQDFTENSRAFVFNSSPNRGRLYSLLVPHKGAKHVTRLYEKGEVLKWPRWLLFDFDGFNNQNPGGLGINTKWFQFYKDHLVKNHNMKDFSAALIKLAAAAGDTQAKALLVFLNERRGAMLAHSPEQSLGRHEYASSCDPSFID